MLSFIKNYFITFIIFIIIESLWFFALAKDLYEKELAYIMKDKASLAPAAIFALIFVAGLVFFVVDPALTQNEWSYALLAGIFYGLITYATYSLTNLSNLEAWPLKVTLIDLLWGMILGGTVSTLSFFVLNHNN